MPKPAGAAQPEGFSTVGQWWRLRSDNRGRQKSTVAWLASGWCRVEPAFEYGAAGQSAVVRQQIARIGVQATPSQFTTTDDKEIVILHIFCDPVIFPISAPDLTAIAANAVALIRAPRPGRFTEFSESRPRVPGTSIRRLAVANFSLNCSISFCRWNDLLPIHRLPLCCQTLTLHG